MAEFLALSRRLSSGVKTDARLNLNYFVWKDPAQSPSWIFLAQNLTLEKRASVWAL